MPQLAKTLAHLGDASRKLEHKELRQLNDIGADAQAEFWAAWQKIDPARRREIATALASLAEDNVEFDFRDVFSAILQDSEAEVRTAAVDGLWEDERLTTLRRLLPMLADDPDDDVRAAVALALGRFAYRSSLDELPARVGKDVRQALLESASNLDLADEVRRRSLEGLGYYVGDDVTKLIGQAYTSGRQPLKASALVAMGHNLDARWLPVFEAELQSNEPALRYEAARATGELGAAAASLLPRLLPLAEGDDSEVAAAAIWALGQIGGEAARRVLKRLAQSDDETVQQAADEALAELQIEDGSFGLI
ncbi:MAG: HEAT repeat domain-containing protein [Chloroflexota bacterium]|nr:HEAT repeat domain-containing protein [Chloroflexota bacterium]